MTTGTTVLGLVPLALGLGEGAELRQPMAIVVIAGLLSSTLLTLVVIPVVYALVTRQGSLEAEAEHFSASLAVDVGKPRAEGESEVRRGAELLRRAPAASVEPWTRGGSE